ncbi:MAG: serine hydrolase domain-containing protein, partial [Antricoccus sp.]
MKKSQIHPSGFALLAMLVLAGCASSPRAVSASDSTEPAVTASTTFDANLRNSINKNVSDIVEKYKVPGAVVGIHLAGKGDYTATIGVGNIQTKATLDAKMPWPLRSVTKSFVVTAILQLVQAGKLGLDDSIAKYTPSLPNANTVTVRELVNMTSGLPEYTNDAFIKAYSADPDRQFTPEDLIGFAATEPAQFPPGTQHVYTNTNTVVLGKIVEMVTGLPISQVLQQNIFGPLKLTHTVYAIDGNDWLKPHPTGYQVDNDKLVPQPNNFSIFAGAGAMISTLADLMIYAPA